MVTIITETTNKHCRIPVSKPLTPSQFIRFIICHFYHGAYLKFSNDISQFEFSFEKTITNNEENSIHITVPYYNAANVWY